MCRHKKRYDKIINHYRNTIVEGYVEKHHIVPKCMGGTDNIKNLVALPAKAHFICHYLLHKMHPDSLPLARAFNMMASATTKYQKGRKKSKGTLYEISKIARSEAMKGIKLSPEHKAKISVPKTNKENYKKPKSQEHRMNISKALKGKRKDPATIEKIRKSKALYFEKKAIEREQTKKKLREQFVQSNMKRKEFAQHIGMNYTTLKKYLSGL